MVKTIEPSRLLRPKKERDWLMACALMGTHKTIRAMRSLGLTFPQLEFLARRIAKVRVVFLDSAQQLKLPKGSRRPLVKSGASYSGRLVTSLDEKMMNEAEGFAWINDVLPWAYDPLGLPAAIAPYHCVESVKRFKYCVARRTTCIKDLTHRLPPASLSALCSSRILLFGGGYTRNL